MENVNKSIKLNARPMLRNVYNGTAMQGREAAACAACSERHRACRDTAEVETGEDMAVQEVRGACRRIKHNECRCHLTN